MAPREPTERYEVRTPRDDAPASVQPKDEPAPSAGSVERAGYLAFVAHEMRNPLSTALWSAELLARLSPEERGGARGDKLAGMCLRTLTRLRHLVEDHFLTERLAMHGIPVRTEAVPLAEAASSAASRLPGVQCHVDIPDSLLAIGDRGMLERALEALVAAASRAGTAVRVTAAAGEGEITVKVHGAAANDDAFRTPDRSTPSDPSGRALSLLMARAVARANGGSLALASDGYVLTLPADDGHAASGDER